jgi:hypothetical protein
MEDLRKCLLTVKITVTGQEDPWKFDLIIQATFTDGSTSKQSLVKKAITLSEKKTSQTFSLQEL